MKKTLIQLTAALLLAGTAGIANAADCKVTVGLVMELTGPAGEYGQAGAKSVEMAFRDINDAGGVLGCDLVTDTRDSQSAGNIAVDAATDWWIGLSAILEEKDGTKSYWAVAHPDGDKPDFHDAACFAAHLP